MRVRIGKPGGAEENFTVYPYDDNFSLLERYALSKPPSLPAYFRVESSLRRFQEGVLVEIRDIRDVLATTGPRDIMEKSIVQALLTAYPGITKRDIGVLWARAHLELGTTQRNEVLFKVDRALFAPNAVDDTVAGYARDVEKGRKSLQDRVNKQRNIYEQLEELEDVPLEATEVSEISSVTVLRLPNNENLIEVFDAFDVSRDIPFVSLIYKGRRFYKAYKHLPPSQVWIEELDADLPDGVRFWVLNTSASKVSSRTAIENFYSKAEWDENNKITIDLDIHSKTSEAEIFRKEEQVYQKLYDALGDRISPEILRSGQSGIKATFKVSDIELVRAVFADMATNNRLVASFMFLDEARQTAMAKDRLYIRYSLKPGDKNRSLLIIITLLPQTETPAIEVRVSRAINVQQVHSFRTVFSKLLRLYLDEREGIDAIYSALIPDYKKLTEISQKTIKEDKKSGRRAVLLKKFNDSLFPKGPYAGECQKKFQPYPVTEDEANAIAEDDPYKVINFPLGSNDWYACAPREQGEVKPGEKAADYPGLKETKAAKFPEYRDQYPLVPCCFKVQQYTKTASEWRLYVRQIEQLRRDGVDEEEIARFFGDPIEAAKIGKKKPKSQGDIGFVKKTVKIIGPDRYGVLPFNFEKLLSILGYQRFFHKSSNIEIYPVLRHAVVWTPDSFLHCLEQAFSSNYFDLDNVQRRERILEVRNEMADIQLDVAKQELYDYTEGEVRRILGDPQAYIDPDMFVTLAQKYYGERIGEPVQIFLFEVDPQTPDGEIVIPRSSQAYLLREYSEDIKSVIIIKYSSSARDYPYQCEIVADLTVRASQVINISFVFQNSALIETIIKLLYDSNEVHIIDPEVERLYVPVNTSTV